MDKFIAVISTVWGAVWGWFWNLRTWIKVVILASLLLGSVSGVLGYSITKRNKIIRGNLAIMAKQLYQNEMLALELKKQKEMLFILRVRKKDKNAAQKIAEGRAKLKVLAHEQRVLKKEQEKVDKDTATNITKVDKMTVAEQIKRMNEVLGDSL